MTTIAPAPSLRGMPLEDLAVLFATTDASAGLGHAILRECARQDRIGRARKTRAGVREQWESGAYSQYLAACEATNGYLLSPAGEKAGISEWPGLWTGSDARAMRYASEELREFWYANPRVSLAAYQRQLRDARRIARDETDLAAMRRAPRPAAVWDVMRDGTRLRETWVTVNGERRPAWWRIAPDGEATLHARLEDAIPPIPVRRVPSAPVAPPQPRLPLQVTPARLCAHRAAQARLCPAQRRWRQAAARQCPTTTGA